MADDNTDPTSVAQALLGRELSAAEERFCRQRGGWPAQEVVGSDDADPAEPSDWEHDHEIAAELIMAVLGGKVVVSPAVAGIRLRGVRITGRLSLEDARLDMPLVFDACRFDEEIGLASADVKRLELADCRLPSLEATAARVHGDLFLFACQIGTLTLVDAVVDGGLYVRGSMVTGGIAADGLQAKGVYVTPLPGHASQIDGRFTLVAARVRELSCSGSVFTATPASILMDGARIGGDVTLTTWVDDEASGEADPERRTFRAAGYVRAVGARAEMFDCDSGRFERGLIAERLVLDGNLYLTEASIRELWLTGATVGRLVDSRESWPRPGCLHIDGLVYAGFGDTADPTAVAPGADPAEGGEAEHPDGGTPSDVASRLDWLGRQSPFAAQPYVQLAKVYSELGDDSSARKVNIKKEWRQLRWHRFDDVVRSAWKVVLGVTLGFGHSPRRAVGILLALWIAGALALTLLDSAQRGIVQARPTSGAKPVSAATDACPPAYPCFSALAYSWDTVVPLVSLGQKDNWRPDGNPEGRRVQRAGHAMTAMGWLIATLAAAGLTGWLRRT